MCVVGLCAMAPKAAAANLLEKEQERAAAKREKAVGAAETKSEGPATTL